MPLIFLPQPCKSGSASFVAEKSREVAGLSCQLPTASEDSGPGQDHQVQGQNMMPEVPHVAQPQSRWSEAKESITKPDSRADRRKAQVQTQLVPTCSPHTISEDLSRKTHRSWLPMSL